MIALPPLLAGFLGTVGLAFIIGLELHAYRRRGEAALEPRAQGFGTTRTITLIASLGFVLWVIAPVTPFCVGLGVLGLALMLDYRKRVRAGDASLVPTVIGLIAYALGPLILTAPLAVIAALAVLVLLVLGEQVQIRRFSDAFPTEEGVTLAKFLVLAGLVYPLLPSTSVPHLAGITWAKIWAAVLVISGISYLGYLAHRYLFPRAGTLLTGVLGGLYSSTAATVVLARSVRAEPQAVAFAPAAVIIATAMMYARLLALIVLLGHMDAALALTLPFGGLFVASLAVAGALAWRARGAQTRMHAPVSSNPLDLPVAFLFAALFLLFAAVTQFVTAHFGAAGLHILSFAVGFSDIDPFILSLLDGRFSVSAGAVTGAVLIASASNNLLKAVYAMLFSRNRQMLPAAGWLCVTAAISFALALG
ncbi:MgtC/SapB family protein [Acidocella sp.]|uniref:MgtC/SapB family protein n=1 Tax=Acidocella sp. TaxID=50710 RepID=UPI003D07E0CF